MSWREAVVVVLDSKQTMHRDNSLIRFLMHKLRSPCYKFREIIGHRSPNECNRFFYPCDAIVDEKRSMLFVSDCGELNIQVFDLFSREFLFNIKTPDRPRFMAIYYNSLVFSSEDGFVYLFDLETRSEIWKSSGASYDTKMANPCGVVADEMRELIYICECDKSRIHIVSGRNGKGKGVLDLKSTKNKNISQGISNPYGIDFTLEGNLVVSSVVDASVHIISKQGQHIREFGGDGTKMGFFRFPSSLIVDKNNGNILICDRNNDRIQVLSSKGEFVKAFGSRDNTTNNNEYLYQPRGLCIDHASGDLYVTDYGNDRVCVYSQFT